MSDPGLRFISAFGFFAMIAITFTLKMSDLPRLDIATDTGAKFSAWKRQWEAYFSLSGLTHEDAKTQVQALCLCFSRNTATVVEALGLSEEDMQNQENKLQPDLLASLTTLLGDQTPSE